MGRRARRIAGIVSTLGTLALAGCTTLTAPFPVEPISSLNIGRTTSEQVRRALGEPRASIAVDGRETWHYGPYRYSPFNQRESRDLVIRFDTRNVVVAYTLNLPYPKDARAAPPR